MSLRQEIKKLNDHHLKDKETAREKEVMNK